VALIFVAFRRMPIRPSAIHPQRNLRIRQSITNWQTMAQIWEEMAKMDGIMLEEANAARNFPRPTHSVAH
jgi:hypothetical protein